MYIIYIYDIIMSRLFLQGDDVQDGIDLVPFAAGLGVVAGDASPFALAAPFVLSWCL